MLPDTVSSVLRRKDRKVLSISPDASVYDAIALMAENSIGARVVVADGKLVGILSERDYARRLILKGKSSKDTLIEEIMTENPVTVSPDNSIEDCMKTMTNRFIRHLPVVDDGALVGMISIGDVVRYIIEEQRGIIEDLEFYITGHHQ